MALGTGLTMLGATVFGAMAAPDLGAYPSQFIMDGKFNGLMVVGAAAASEDVLGVVDIATSLQFASKVETAVGSSGETTSLTGDVYQIGTSADQLEIGEYLGKVKSTITETELGALESTQVRTSKGTTAADQYLKFNSTGGLKVAYEENRKNVVSDYLKSVNGDNMFVYEMQFPEGLKSSSYSSTDSNTKVTVTSTAATTYLNDIDDEDLFILGDTFNIVETTVKNDSTMRMTLMGGALQDTLKEGETKTYELDGKSYEVTVVIIADSGNNGNLKTKLMVNGQVTRSLSDGDTDTLDDGTVIGVKSLLGNEGAETGGADLVSFYIGADKIEFSENNFGDALFSSTSPKIDEETIEDAAVEIDASWTSDEVKITALKYKLKADSKESGDLYIEKDGSVRDMLDEPTGLLSRVWDVKYLGLSAPETSTVEVANSGDDAYYLDFTTQEGIEYSIPLVDNSNDKGHGWKFGEDDNKLVFMEASNTTVDFITAPIFIDDYFIVSKGSNNDKAFTHVLTFNSVDITDGTLSFSDLDGSTKEVTFTPFAANGCASTTSNLIVGGESYAVTVCTNSYTSDTAYRLAIDLNGDGDLNAGDKAQITFKGGGILTFAGVNGTAAAPTIWNTTAPLNGQIGIDYGNLSGGPINMSVTTLAKFTDSNADQVFYFNVFPDTNNKVDLDFVASTTAGSQVNTNLSRNSDKNSDIKKGMSIYGVYVEENQPSDSTAADTLTIDYPVEQVFGQVYVIGGDSASSKTAKKNTVVEYQRIQVGKSVLDSDVADWKADNLIVVGGPCANTIAAEILGISSSKPACYQDFPVQDGQGIVKMVQNGDNVAILVAGFSAADTRKAAQVVANYEDYASDLSGKAEVVVSGNKIMAAQVQEEAAAEETTEAPVENATE